MTRRIRSSQTLAAAVLATLCAGCSRGDLPDIGYVEGTVTLDGEPLPAAGVSFEQPGFRSSLAVTDEGGWYELKYLRDIKGATVGTHKVKIDRIPTQEGQRLRPLPAEYNRNTTLEREVKPGNNTIDFDLESEP